jgi:hypothetical protein
MRIWQIQELSAPPLDLRHPQPGNVFHKAREMFHFTAVGAGKTFKLTQFSSLAL